MDNRLMKLIEQCRRIVDEFSIDLSGLRVVTECASGAFMVTPLIAALSGAQVFAVGQTDRFGGFEEKREKLRELLAPVGLEKTCTVYHSVKEVDLSTVDLVTNLGPVRPISREVLSFLKDDAVIATMCEAWEVRSDDFDIEFAVNSGKLVVETLEEAPQVRTFDYLGPLAFKLMLEEGQGIFFESIVVVGSGIFAARVTEFLGALGSTVFPVSPKLHDWQTGFRKLLESGASLVIFAENEVSFDLFPSNVRGNREHYGVFLPTLIHVAGQVDVSALREEGFHVVPDMVAPFPRMSLTTDYVGAEPVIRLHAAGLASGGVAAQGVVAGLSEAEIVRNLEKLGLGRLVGSIRG